MKVSMFGRVSGTPRCALRDSVAWVEMLVKAPREHRTDTGCALEIRNSRSQYALQATELPEQCAALGGPETWHGLQYGLTIPLCTLAPVPGDGEAMRLVAHPLH